LPLPTWIQLGVAFSVLFSGMALWHRFHLWRIDAHRVKIEREIAVLFGLDAPILVPMGEEMAYRYQEMLIAALPRTLRLQKEQLTRA
jgi:hypothetical protein